MNDRLDSITVIRSKEKDKKNNYIDPHHQPLIYITYI